MDRRRFLTLVGGATIVVAFDPLARSWVSRAETGSGRCFDDAPDLDGALVFDRRSLAADARDKGNMIVRRPCAVLRPGSVADVQKMIRFCADRSIKVAVRGRGHTTFGHTLADDGLVIENEWLDAIHSLGPAGADVGPGVTWRTLLEKAFAVGLTPPAITGYTKLSVAGTLSVGGVGGQTTNRAGLQIERVQELDVVTGSGDLVTCSPTSNRDLFEAVLGGVGQCGVITRARIDLVPAKQRARVYTLHYPDAASFFPDFRTLLYRGELDAVYNVWFPFGTKLLYELTAVKFYDPESPPDDAQLMRDLSVPPQAAAARDSTYLDYLFLVDDLFDTYIAAGYDRLVKPWFDVWLPESIVEPFVTEVLAGLSELDIGATGFVLILPQLRGSITRPFYRVPDVPQDEFVYLFDVLTSSLLPGDDPHFARTMLRRNRRWYDEARAGGGTRYLIGSVEFDGMDWEAHYGDSWAEFMNRKHSFDPAGILSPGLGIFD